MGTSKIEFLVTMEFASVKERSEYLKKAKAAKIEALSQKEEGNIRYEYMLPLKSNRSLVLLEQWENLSLQKVHQQSPHYQIAMQLRNEYIKNSEVICMEYNDATDESTGEIEFVIEIHFETKDIRDIYLVEAEKAELAKLGHEDAGNIRYEYYLSTANDQTIFLIELWESVTAHRNHQKSDYEKDAMRLKAAYVKNSLVDHLEVRRLF